MAIILVIICTLISGFGLLIIFNSGNPAPFTDMNGNRIEGSISEKTFLDINGYQQGLFIKSKNIKNPVLLYLHGGMPDYFLTQKFPTALENYFTVVWWEQRGAGISYDKNRAKELITTQQLIEDTKTITNYLKERFGKEKIYLMGHSGGTFIGIQTVVQAPELYHAYIAVAQITNQFESEKLAYNYMQKKYVKRGDKQMILNLRKAQITTDSLPDSYLRIRDDAMHKIGIGTMRNMKSIITGLFFPSLLFREYTVAEKYRLWQAKANYGASIVWNDIIKSNIATQFTDVNIPVYFFHGKHDYTVSYPLAKTYFDQITAPKKHFFTFSESAHSPIFEEPEKCGQIISKYIICSEKQLKIKY